MRDLLDRWLSWLYTWRLFGSRCIDFDPHCHCCAAWASHDELFDIH